MHMKNLAIYVWYFYENVKAYSVLGSLEIFKIAGFVQIIISWITFFNYDISSLLYFEISKLEFCL